jgi:hypothetical protein
MVPTTVPGTGKKTVDQVLVEAGFEAVFKNTVSVTNQPAFSVYLAFMLCLTIVYPFVPTAFAINRNYPQRAHHAHSLEKSDGRRRTVISECYKVLTHHTHYGRDALCSVPLAAHMPPKYPALYSGGL